jgi:hypothetical protein
MLLSDLPDDILYVFVDKPTSRVCRRWYNLWRIKPLLIDLRGGRDINLKKYSNVVGLCLDKFNDLDSYLSIASSVNFPTLKILYLNNNYIIDDNILGTLTNLTTLSLWNNTTISSKSVEKLTNLVSLDLRYNSKIHSDIISALPNLTKFKFYSSIPIEKSAYEHLSQIRELSIKNNVMSVDLAKLTSLTKLRLFQRRQWCNIEDAFSRLMNLTSITAIQCHFPAGPKLESLRVYCPNLKEIEERDCKYGHF